MKHGRASARGIHNYPPIVVNQPVLIAWHGSPAGVRPLMEVICKRCTPYATKAS